MGGYERNHVKRSLFNTRENRWWALLPLLAVLWHSLYTALFLHPHYLLFVCYTANFLLGLGILWRSGLIVGMSMGWVMVALPLWLHDAFLNKDWEPSGIAFHISGVFVGLLAFRDFRFPKGTWAAALALGLILQGLSRMFTQEELNVNAAFRTYQGWETFFTSYSIYLFVMLVGFGAFFIFLERINHYFFFRRPVLHGRD